MGNLHLPTRCGRTLGLPTPPLLLAVAVTACGPIESDSVESEVIVTEVGDAGAAYSVNFVAGGAGGMIESGVAQVLLDDYLDHTEDPIVVEFTCDFGNGPSTTTHDIRTRHGELALHYFRPAFEAPFEVPCTLRFDKVSEIDDVADVTLEWHIEAGLTVLTRKSIFLEVEIEET